jgi:arsenate reductase-like glutaredoxin family protein
VLSKRSKVYRERQAEIDTMDDDGLIAAMVAEPTLLRRPLIVCDAGHAIGFDAAALRTIIDNGKAGEDGC